MKRDQIFEKLQIIFKDFFESDDLAITFSTVKEDIEDWDSVAHIQIVMEIENEFNIQFAAEDIARLVSIEAIIEALETLTE